MAVVYASLPDTDPCPLPPSGVARVAEVRGQAGGKGLHQGGKRIREPEGPTLYWQELSEPLKAPSRWDIRTAFGSFWELQEHSFIKKNIYRTQVDNTLTGLTGRSWYITQDQKKYFNANLVPHLETKILLLCGNEQTFPNKNWRLTKFMF